MKITKDSMDYIKNLNQIDLSMNPKAVLFDCFGTLMEIKDKQKPYQFLFEELKKQGFNNSHYAHWVMSRSLSIDEIEQETKIQLSHSLKLEFLNRVYKEVQSVRNFIETNEVLLRLKGQGIKLGMCSNLALPYGEPAKHNTVPLHYYFLSYEIGFIKPQIELFNFCQEKMELDKTDILFVGDNERDDYRGALKYGFHAQWLKRD